jgi:uncharacterized protein YfaQ (DUF2300 family)
MKTVMRTVLALLLLAAATAWAQQKAGEPIDVVTRPEPIESRYCAREGETAKERIARLRTALRLAEAEERVNAGMGRKRRVVRP